MAFGGVAVDSLGFTDDFPAASLLTGMLGNALGFRRSDPNALQSLQDRLRYAVRIDRQGQRLSDYQTADLDKSDSGWTTAGCPEGRAGGANSYKGQHQRHRDYHADAALTVAICLHPDDTEPTLPQLAQALDYPARPLFIGRKPCLPASRLVLDLVEAESLLAALQAASHATSADSEQRYYCLSQRPADARSIIIHGRRNWRTNVHQGREQWTASEIGASDE